MREEIDRRKAELSHWSRSRMRATLENWKRVDRTHLTPPTERMLIVGIEALRELLTDKYNVTDREDPYRPLPIIGEEEN